MKSKNTLRIALSRRTSFVILGLILVYMILFSFAYAADQAIATPFTTEQGDCYIPLRSTCDQLGFDVHWFADSQRAVVQAGNDTIEYSFIERNETSKATTLIVDGRMFVPIEQFAAQKQLLYVMQNEEQLLLYRIPEVNSTRMIQNLGRIASTERPVSSLEIGVVREFLASYLDEIGYEVTLQPIFNPLAALMPPSHPLYDPNPQPLGYNIVAQKLALEDTKDTEILILGAAYDSHSNSHGANGNGSGVAGLLEIADLMKDIPSHAELRLIFFDAEASSSFGSYHYASSLTDDEVERTMAMIDLNTIGSKAIGEIMVYTLEGLPSLLTEQFHDLAIAATPQGSFTNFYSLAIPTVLISEEQKAEAYFVLDRKNDILDIISQTKLQYAVTSAVNVVAHLMSDASVPFRQSNSGEISKDWIGASIDISKRLVFGEMTKAEIEEKIGIELAQVPVSPSLTGVNSSFSAYLNWWGQPQKTYFQFATSDYILTDIRIVVSGAKQLIPLLDEQFTRIENIDEYLFTIDYLSSPFAYTILSSQLPPNRDNADSRMYWRSNVGHAFILEQSDVEATLWLSAFRRNTSYEIDSTGAWIATLDDLEKRAWDSVEKMLRKTQLLEQVHNVIFIDDGYGGETLAITASIESTIVEATTAFKQSLTLFVDALDIADPQGALYSENGLFKEFLKSWTTFKFTDPTQVERAAITDENSQVISITRGEYLPTSCLTRYVEAFGEQWVLAYIAQEEQKNTAISNSTLKELSTRLRAEPMLAADFIVQDLGDTFIFYMSGDKSDAESHSILKKSFADFYGADYQEVINGFYDQFPEIVKLKGAFIQ